MFCPKCGEKNIEGAKFCAKCGSNFENAKVSSNTKKTSSPVKTSESIMGTIFRHMIVGFIKPFASFKKTEKNLSTVSASLIYSGIVCGIMWILSIITSIFRAARNVSYGWSGKTVTWNFGIVRYLKIIGVNLLVYVGLVAAIAGVYCLGSLIVKKTISYFKMLSITSTAIMPYVLTSVFLAPLFGMLNIHVGAVISIAGLVYSFLIFLGLVNEEIDFKSKEQKLYFHLVCMGVLCIVFYFTFYNFGTMNVVKDASLIDSIYNYLR